MRTLLATTLAVILCCCLLPAAALAAKYQIKFGHDHKETSPHHQAALWLKNKLEKESGGEIEVTIYPTQMLGTGTQMVEMLQTGAIQMLAVPTSNVQVIQPGLQVLELPFLFPDQKTLYEKLDGPLGKALYAPLADKNILGLTFWESGFKEMTCNYPIHSPADLKGRKMRIMPSPVIREQYLALGASPVPIDFQELYNALQQGVVDGEENPLMSIVTMKFYEVQKYVAMTNHAWLGYAVMVNKGFYESLPEKYQKLLTEAAKESNAFEVDLINKQNADYLATIKGAGTTVIDITPAEFAQFKAAVAPVYDWFVKNIADGQKYLDLARN